MRRLADAKQSWQELQQYPSLAELKEAVRLDGHLSVPNNGLRSACWKAFLLFDNVDTASWPRTLLSSRSAYNSLRLHFLRHIEFFSYLSYLLVNLHLTHLFPMDCLSALFLHRVAFF
jgi:TBC1 domain family protein 5